MSDLSPSEILTAAAKLLRERATAATPGPWSWNRWHSNTCPADCNDPACFLLLVGSPHAMVGSADVDRPEVFAVERSVQERGEDDAAWIALMHPGVGLALADWLDDAAEGDAQGEINPYTLAVARQFLGGES
jgi:hypothetical protein